MLTRYANERRLYRLAQSSHATSFVLKGAALFMLWTDKPHRATRDLDLLGYGDPSIDRIRAVLSDLISLEVDDDGLIFDRSTLEVDPIREDPEYGGIRAVVVAVLAGARVRLQIDVGFGDVVTPDAIDIAFPTLLDLPAPRLRAYTKETVVAEKLEAIVQLGLANSRMKDFYDLVILSRMFEFDGAMLVRAIQATFARRKTPVPVELPVGLSATFAADPSKVAQWSAFLRKSGASEPGELDAIIDEIVVFVWQPLEAASSGVALGLRWPPRGRWQA